MSLVTIVFADLTGSTGIFESLGNIKAAEVVTKTTQWIGKICLGRGGRVIKYLGDGVLMSFANNLSAIHSVVDIQRSHRERVSAWPDNMKMQIKIGMARGEVVEQDGDCFGDAVNVASRLSDLSGADQIFVTKEVVDELTPSTDIRFRRLGPMNIRGKSEQMSVYRIEWQGEDSSEFMTVQANLDQIDTHGKSLSVRLELSWLDVNLKFNPEDLPVFLGRVSDAQFIVNDPRVSRLHAKIDLRGDVFVLEDVSSFGTWVRFAGSEAVIALRRQQCVLLDKGEIALGSSFEDFSTPTVSYRIFNPLA